jgi:hypothetical protein
MIGLAIFPATPTCIIVFDLGKDEITTAQFFIIPDMTDTDENSITDLGAHCRRNNQFSQ